MKYLSVCAGIEAATVAWHPLGWTPVAFSEVDRFPSAVLAHHYPDIPNVGDMTKIATGDTHVGSFDLLVGGTPCQSFSVAGLRGGLADPRGNLALAYLEIARRYRPKWLVWENVPGVLSSNGGRDFGSILGGMGELGYGFAYRVLDAQFFGVAQRRRRVFVVGCLGDWRGAAAVLFERQSLSGHPAPSRSPGKDVADSPAQGVALRGREGGGTAELTGDVACALRASQGGGDKPHVAQCITTGTGKRYDAETETLLPVAFNHQTGGDFRPMVQNDQANALQANQGQAVAICENQRGEVRASDVAGAVSCGGGKPGQGYQAVAFQEMENANASASEADAREVLRQLRKAVGEEAFTQWGFRILNSFQPEKVLRPEVHGSAPSSDATQGGHKLDDSTLPRPEHLPAGSMRELWERGADGRSPQGRRLVEQLARELGAPVPQLPHEGTPRAAVRRLTPREAERLQGFPDNYTAIPYRNGTAPDGPRYKALGNAMAVPVIGWIGKRIQQVEQIKGEDCHAA